MKRLKTSALGMVILTIILFACKKDNNSGGTKSTTEVSTTEQVSISDDQVNDGLSNAMDAADGNEDGNVQFRENGCAVVTADTTNKTITVDFGTGCVSPITGRTRSGKIVIGYTGPNYLHATQRTFQFINYHSRDSVLLNGVFVMSNIGYTASTVSFTLTTSDFNFQFNDGTSHILSSFTRNYTIDLGANIFDNSDNVITITGSTTGINRESENYILTITSPVIIKGECTVQHNFYPAAGTYDVQIANKPKFSFSWGSGTCDKMVSVTIFGATMDINLH